MSKLEIFYRPVANLRVNPANARKHGKKQIAKIAASIQSFGFNVPLLTDGEGQLVAGHGRLRAARYIGLPEVPTLAIAGLTEARLRDFAIADNRIADLG